MDEDDNGNQEEQDLGDQLEVSSSQAKKRKGRGPTKAIQTRKPMFLEFDEFELPTGEWEKNYGQQLGRCALKLDINVHEWNNVDQANKDSLWEETKRMFHIDEDPEGARKKNFLSALGSRFRHHKSWLVSRFVDRTKAPSEGSPNANLKPWELYEGYITEDQWKNFELYVTSEAFKTKSAIGKKVAAKNIHRHILGQKSYSRKRKDWIKEKRISAPSESASADSRVVVNQRIKNRALEWCLAHQKQTQDGKWEVNPNKPETVRVVNLVMEHLETETEEEEEGKAPERGIDALTKALGKKDSRGYVKCLGRSGVGVGHEKAFGKVYLRRRRSTQSGCSFEELETVKVSLTQEFEEKFEARLQERVAVEVQSYLASLSTSKMLSNVLQAANSNPQATIPDQQPRVIDVVTSPSKKFKSSSQNKDIVGSGGPWSEVTSCVRIEEMIGNDLVENFTEECELLYYKMCDLNQDSISIPLKAPLFYLKENIEILVTSNDVSQFLKGAWASVSLIHVYILYLVQDFISYFNISEITFLCPQKISSSEIKRDSVEAQFYVKKAFLSELEKNGKHCKFILAPYIQDNHWILIVIDLSAGVAFVFDPATQSNGKTRSLVCQNIMSIAYKFYRSSLKGLALKRCMPNLVWKPIECAQQSDETECGYYVMRYMYEIIEHHSECKGDLQEDYMGRSKAYNDAEMTEVREQWAKFFRTTFLLK